MGRRWTYREVNQPKREICPCCSKKGVGIWHTMHEFGFRDRSCRYCNYTEFQNWVGDHIGDHVDGYWKTDVEREQSFNRGRMEAHSKP